MKQHVQAIRVSVKYGTARFKLQECTRVQLHSHDTSKEIFVTCLRAHERLMTYELPVQTSRTHACAIAHTQHVHKNIRCVFFCARNIDEVRTYELPVPS